MIVFKTIIIHSKLFPSKELMYVAASMFIIHVFACSLAVDCLVLITDILQIAVVILDSYLLYAVVYSKTSDN